MSVRLKVSESDLVDIRSLFLFLDEGKESQ